MKNFLFIILFAFIGVLTASPPMQATASPEKQVQVSANEAAPQIISAVFFQNAIQIEQVQAESKTFAQTVFRWRLGEINTNSTAFKSPTNHTANIKQSNVGKTGYNKNKDFPTTLPRYFYGNSKVTLCGK